MKTINFLIVASISLIFAGCTIQTGTIGYDDTYYDDNELTNYQAQEESFMANSREQAYQDPTYSNQVRSYSQQLQNPSSNSNDDAIADTTYSSDYQDYNSDNYYDYEYTARINRFHRPYSWLNYYDDYYTDLYWYTFNPLFWGTSIYLGYSWWWPSYYYRPYYWGWGYYNDPYWGWNYVGPNVCYFNNRDRNSFSDRGRGAFDPNGRGLTRNDNYRTGFPTNNSKNNPNLTLAQNQNQRTRVTNASRSTERFQKPQRLQNQQTIGGNNRGSIITNNNNRMLGSNNSRYLNNNNRSAQTYTPPTSRQPRSSNEFRSTTRTINRSIFSNGNNSNNRTGNYRQSSLSRSSSNSSFSRSSSSRSSGGGFSGGGRSSSSSSHSGGGRSR